MFFGEEEKDIKTIQIKLLNLMKKPFKNLEISSQIELINDKITAIATFRNNLAMGTKSSKLYLYSKEGLLQGVYENSNQSSIITLLSLDDSSHLIAGTSKGFFIMDPKKKIQNVFPYGQVSIIVPYESGFITYGDKNLTKYDIKGIQIIRKPVPSVLEILELNNKNILLSTNFCTIHILDSSFNNVKNIIINKYWISHIIQTDTSKFVCLSYESKFKIFSSDWVEEKKFPIQGWAPSLANYSFGRFLTGSKKGIITLWSSNGDLEYELIQHKSKINLIFVLKDERIVSIDVEGMICIWNKNQLLQSFKIDLLKDEEIIPQGIVEFENGKLCVCFANRIIILIQVSLYVYPINLNCSRNPSNHSLFKKSILSLLTLFWAIHQ